LLANRVAKFEFVLDNSDTTIVRLFLLSASWVFVC